MLTGCAARVQSMLSRDSRLGAAPLSAAGILAERRGIGTIGNCDCRNRCVRSCSFWPANPLKRGWHAWSRDVLHEQHRSHYRTAEQCGDLAPFGVCLKFVVGSPIGTPEQLQRASRLKTSGSMRSSVRAEQLLDPPGWTDRTDPSGPPHVVRLRPGLMAGGHSDLGAYRRSGDGQNVSGRANLDGSAGVREGFQQLFSFTTPEWT